MSSCVEDDGAILQALVRTAYLVPDVYAALQKEFPGSVVLQPGTIELDERGQLAYRLQNPELPALANVDFFAYIAQRVSGAAPSSSAFTHGKQVMPAIVASIWTPEGPTLIAISKGLFAEESSGNPSALLQISASVGKKVKKPSGVAIVSNEPVEISETAWTHVVDPQSNEPFLTDTWHETLALLVDRLKQVDRATAGPQLGRLYAAIYAEDLALAPSASEELVSEFLSAELQFTTQVSEEFFSSLRSGEVGESVRQTMIAEREFNRKATTAGWMGGLATLASGMAGFAGPIPIGPQMLLSTMQQQASLTDAQRQFTGAVQPLTIQQHEVVVRLESQQSDISASSIDDLRTQFRNLLKGT